MSNNNGEKSTKPNAVRHRPKQNTMKRTKESHLTNVPSKSKTAIVVIGQTIRSEIDEEEETAYPAQHADMQETVGEKQP